MLCNYMLTLLDPHSLWDPVLQFTLREQTKTPIAFQACDFDSKYAHTELVCHCIYFSECNSEQEFNVGSLNYALQELSI